MKITSQYRDRFRRSLAKLDQLRLDYALHMVEKKRLSFQGMMSREHYGYSYGQPVKERKIWRDFLKKWEHFSPKEIQKRKRDFFRELFGLSHFDFKEKKKSFSWKPKEIDGKTMATIHFSNSAFPQNPFKGKEHEKRWKEMKKIFEEIHKKYPKIRYVQGSSWLYNTKSYKQFHPPEFLKNLRPALKHKNKTPAYWGQFIRANGMFNQRLAKRFRKDWVFPFMRLTARCPIKYYYRMYGIDRQTDKLKGV